MKNTKTIPAAALLAIASFADAAFAAKTVRAILRYLRTGNPPGNVLCNIRYVRGDTF